MEKTQREHLRHEQLKAIRREPEEADEQQIEVEEFRKKIEEAGRPEEPEKEARRELDRLSKLPTAAAEYVVNDLKLNPLGHGPGASAPGPTFQISSL
jgi:ATP-dependent Lon protease